MPTSVPAAGTLEGEVVVTVRESVETKGLKLQIGWGTHGRGNRFRQIVMEQTLFAGELKAGDLHFPFALSVPTGPLTFHGENISVDWFAIASIDFPWAADPKVECGFTLERTDTAEPYVFGSHVPVTGLQGTRRVSVGDGCLIAILVVFLVGFFSVFAFVASKTFQQNVWMMIFISLFALAFCGMPLYLLYQLLGRKWANRRAGDVKVTVNKVAPAAGELLKVDLQFTPKRALHLNNIAVTLTCIERATSGSGTNRSTYTNTIHEEQTLLMDSNRSVARHEPVEFTQLVQIPVDAPPSFVAGDNEVLWSIAIRIDIRSAMDWQDSFTLAVRP
jgi:hypothetical protein